MREGPGLTEEDRGRIAAYLAKSPYERRPEDLLPVPDETPPRESTGGADDR